MKRKKPLESLLSAAGSVFQPGYSYRVRTDNPIRVHNRIIYIVQDGAESDALVFKCPCGCKKTIQLNLLTDARPCWSFSLQKGKITIYPSIRATGGCRSHFVIRKGTVVWV